MSDVTVAEGTAEAVKKFLTVELRGKCGSVDVDTDAITNNEVYEYVFKTGLETIVNKVGMAKLATGITKLSGEAHTKAVAAVVEQARKNVAALYDGTIKGMKSATKISGAVNTEAMRLAKAVVKDLLRQEGYKVSAFDAKTLTAYAKDVLKANPELVKKAQANLDERAATPVKGLSVKAMLGDQADNEELKAKPKSPPKPKAKGAVPLSAKQAAMVAPRQKPAAGHQAH